MSTIKNTLNSFYKILKSYREEYNELRGISLLYKERWTYYIFSKNTNCKDAIHKCQGYYEYKAMANSLANKIRYIKKIIKKYQTQYNNEYK